MACRSTKRSMRFWTRGASLPKTWRTASWSSATTVLASIAMEQVPSRLSLMASQVSDAYGTKTRVNPDAVWNGSFLPSKAELNVLPAPKK